MKIRFTLNYKNITSEIDAQDRLSDVLQTQSLWRFNEETCAHDFYSSCTILLNNLLVPSPLVPAISIDGKEILTIEGFSKTDDYKDIRSGFERAGFHPCSRCAESKILLAHTVIEENPNPRKGSLKDVSASARCRCTSYTKYMEGIIFAAQYRRRRLHA